MVYFIERELEDALKLLREWKQLNSEWLRGNKSPEHYNKNLFYFRDGIKLIFNIIIALEKVIWSEVKDMEINMPSLRKERRELRVKGWKPCEKMINEIERDIKINASKVTQMANIIKGEEKSMERKG